MTNRNKYGLSRTIPEHTKRAIRQNSKFGCVICRLAVFTYEHINPVFVDAQEHNPDHMCILCPTHQRDSTDGVLSKTEIAEAYKRIRTTENIAEPKRHGFFDLFSDEAIIQIGPTQFKGFTSIINVDGENFLSFKKNLDTNTGFQISGRFLDDRGDELFRIENNEWIGNGQLWDINLVGPTLTIRRRKGEILFSVKKHLDLNLLLITHLNMWVLPFHIKTDKKQLLVGQHDLINDQYIYYGIDGDFFGGNCALYLDSKRCSSLSAGSWVAKGGMTYISGTGICIGHGRGIAHFRNISVAVSKNIPIFYEFFPRRIQLQLFVYGVLEIRVVKYPDWTEKEFYLYGYRLDSRPFSWGSIGENSDGNLIELYHFSGSVEAPLEYTEGFVGYWADDLVDKSWADRVFECSVWEGEEPNRHPMRVKRCNISGREIESELNPETGRWFHPCEFSGISVWKNKLG